MSGTVYRFYATDGDLLYVGCTSNWPRRMRQHQGARPWWSEVASATFEHFDNINAARAAETKAITDERPAFNLSPPSVAARTWEARKERAARLHAAGESCGLAPCSACRLRWFEELYREQTGGDIRAAVRELRASGCGRHSTANRISRRLRLPQDANGLSVRMVELIEAEESTEATAS